MDISKLHNSATLSCFKSTIPSLVGKMETESRKTLVFTRSRLDILKTVTFTSLSGTGTTE